ncbi:hypothetical protein Tco_0415794 [Tanacetum coccineum]
MKHLPRIKRTRGSAPNLQPQSRLEMKYTNINEMSFCNSHGLEKFDPIRKFERQCTVGHSSIPEILKIRTCGSQVFLGKLVQDEPAEQCSFSACSELDRVHWKFEPLQTLPRLDGCGTYCEQEWVPCTLCHLGYSGFTTEEVGIGGAGAGGRSYGFFLSESNARHILSSATSMKQLGWKVRTYLGNQLLSSCLNELELAHDDF